MFNFEVSQEGVQYTNRGIASVTIEIEEDETFGAMGAIRLEDDLPLWVMDDFERAFDRVVDWAKNVLSLSYVMHNRRNPPADTLLGAKITGHTDDDQKLEIGVAYREMQAFTGQAILNAISNVLNSSQSFQLTMAITFSMRWRPEHNVEGKRMMWRGDMNFFVRAKKGLVMINPEDDMENESDCLLQTIVIGFAQCVLKGEDVDRAVLNMDEHSYRKMISDRSKYRNRKFFSNVLRQKLSEVGIVFHNGQSLYDQLYMVEQFLRVHICLYSFQGHLMVEYPKLSCLPYCDCRPTIFGLLIHNGQNYEHVHFISKVTCLVEKTEGSRSCLRCFALYTRSRTCNNEACQQGTCQKGCPLCHTCEGVCETCLSKECGERAAYRKEDRALLEKCSICRFPFYNDLCKFLHQQVCKQQFIQNCPLGCGRRLHRGFKCDETSCMLCSAKILFSERLTHECFLQRQKMKKPSTKYWAYDVETCLDESKRHILYLIICWPIYSHPDIDSLTREYSATGEVHVLPEDPARPFFVFWGLGSPGDGSPETTSGVYRFFNLVRDRRLLGSTFFAHNAGRYDSIFVENFLVRYAKVRCEKIERGLRILQLHFPTLEVTFKDTLNWIPTSLRDMASDFKLPELAKGFFPHNLVTTQFLKDIELHHFMIPRPARNCYPSDYHNSKSGKNEKKEFEKFWEEEVKLIEQETVGGILQRRWDFKGKAILYCISDVQVLGEVIKLFREKTIKLTDEIERGENVKRESFDPFQYVTLPSAVMKFYLSQLLPEDTIGVIDSFLPSNAIEAEKWLIWEEVHNNCQIIRQDFFEGIAISGISQGILFRYLNCYMHGCKTCYPQQGLNTRLGMSFKACNEKTQMESLELRNRFRGIVRSIWSCQWNQRLESEDVKGWFDEKQEYVDERLPLDPRDAYKGGITEVYKLYCPLPFQMVDFVSQYPTSLLGSSYDPITNLECTWKMPVGQPKRLKFPSNAYSFDKLGVVKCRVLPPRHLYAPFLSYASPSLVYPGTTETLYGLCKCCMDERNLNPCPHSDQERSFTGSWTCSEIRYALELGYQVLSITEVWEYEESRNDLFRNFIIPFMITKIRCKKEGLVDDTGEFTAKGREIWQYVYDITDVDLKPSDFEDADAERIIAKLIMNSFYGKWGQRGVYPETKSLSENSEKDMQLMQRLMTDTDIDITFGRVIPVDLNHRVILLEYVRKKPVLKGDKFKNDIIAAHVTAYGRIMLNKAVIHASRIEHQGSNLVLNTDTDSVMFIKPSPEIHVFHTGFRIGDLELELKDGLRATFMKRKAYAYETESGKVVIKQKGICMKQSMASKFTYDKLLDLIIASIQCYQKEMEKVNDRAQVLKKMRVNKDDAFPTIEVNQVLFKTVRGNENPLLAEKQTIVQKKKTFSGIADAKRVPLIEQWNFDRNRVLDTVPFGYTLN